MMKLFKEGERNPIITNDGDKAGKTNKPGGKQ